MIPDKRPLRSPISPGSVRLGNARFSI